MRNILLIHQDKIQHYRVSIYNHLYDYSSDSDYQLNVISKAAKS